MKNNHNYLNKKEIEMIALTETAENFICYSQANDNYESFIDDEYLSFPSYLAGLETSSNEKLVAICKTVESLYDDTNTLFCAALEVELCSRGLKGFGNKS